MESSLCILNTADFWVIPWSVVELTFITLLKTAESSLNDYQFPTVYEWDCVPNALFYDEMIFDLSLHRLCSCFHSHLEFVICGLPDFSGTFCSFVVIHHLWIAYTLSAPAFSSTRHLQWCYSHGRRVAIWMSPWELSTLQTCGKSLCVNRYLLQ